MAKLMLFLFLFCFWTIFVKSDVGCCNGLLQLLFSVTTDAYHTYSGSIIEASADVAIDDIYVYNTSCKSENLQVHGTSSSVRGR